MATHHATFSTQFCDILSNFAFKENWFKYLVTQLAVQIITQVASTAKFFVAFKCNFQEVKFAPIYVFYYWFSMDALLYIELHTS